MSEDLGELSRISFIITTHGKPLKGAKVTFGEYSGISDKDGRITLKKIT